LKKIVFQKYNLKLKITNYCQNDPHLGKLNIYAKSVDIEIDGKFHIHGKPE